MLVKTALSENKSLKQVLIEKDVIPEKYLNEILDARKMTEPGVIDKRVVEDIRKHRSNK